MALLDIKLEGQEYMSINTQIALRLPIQVREWNGWGAGCSEPPSVTVGAARQAPPPVSDSEGICIFNKFQVVQILLVWDHWMETRRKGQEPSQTCWCHFYPQFNMKHVKM